MPEISLALWIFVIQPPVPLARSLFTFSFPQATLRRDITPLYALSRRGLPSVGLLLSALEEDLSGDFDVTDLLPFSGTHGFHATRPLGGISPEKSTPANSSRKLSLKFRSSLLGHSRTGETLARSFVGPRLSRSAPVSARLSPW